jgi:hypothetical protein
MLIDDVTHWRKRADETRALASHLTVPETRRVMLGLADSYDRLAQQLAARIAREAGQFGDR